ncbi:MAG TPA: glycosyltransferase family 2 protein [Sphingomonas sp.]|jgi:glycosyltransferase involved in cell wall biosynthesis
MNNPKVSVMIPTYNQAGFIVRAIRSALDQDYANLEVVVADDCSPDETSQVVRDFITTSGDPRVTYHRNETNLGILRNYHDTLFEKASGDWAVNLDADDVFVDRAFLSKAMELAARDPAISLVFADYCEQDEASGVQTPIRNQPHPTIMADLDFLDRYADDRIVWNHNSIVYDRHLAMQRGCYWEEGAQRNDWESFLRLTIGHKVGRLDCIAAAWVQHGANETRRLDLTKYLNNFTLIDGVADYARAQGLEPGFVAHWHARMVAGSARSTAVAYLRARDYRGLWRFMRHVRERAPGLPLRLLREPGFLARAVLASNARLYAAVKRRARRGAVAG